MYKSILQKKILYKFIYINEKEKCNEKEKFKKEE